MLFENVLNLDIPLEGLGVYQVGQAIGSAARQKPVLAHYTRYRVTRGHEIPLVSNLKEHIWVLYQQQVRTSDSKIFLMLYIPCMIRHGKLVLANLAIN